MAKRDSMKSRTYTWETDIVTPVYNQRLAEEQIKELTPRLARHALIKLVDDTTAEDLINRSLRIDLPKRDGPAQGGLWGITLPPWGRRIDVVAHEVAHFIEHHELLIDRDRSPDPGHGPHWLGWYLETLSHVPTVFEVDEELPLRRIIRSANFYRLKIAPKSLRVVNLMEKLKVKAVH